MQQFYSKKNYIYFLKKLKITCNREMELKMACRKTCSLDISKHMKSKGTKSKSRYTFQSNDYLKNIALRKH